MQRLAYCIHALCREPQWERWFTFQSVADYNLVNICFTWIDLVVVIGCWSHYGISCENPDSSLWWSYSDFQRLHTKNMKTLTSYQSIENHNKSKELEESLGLIEPNGRRIFVSWVRNDEDSKPILAPCWMKMLHSCRQSNLLTTLFHRGNTETFTTELSIRGHHMSCKLSWSLALTLVEIRKIKTA